MPALPPRRFQVHRYTGRTVDTDAWQLLDMALLYRCIRSFSFDSAAEVFHITDGQGRSDTMGSERVRETYFDAVISMVESLIASDTSAEEFTTEIGVRMRVDPVPYIPDPLDRADVYPLHWKSPHGPSGPG